MPYTPTPFVNFQYDPEKSDIRRLLDSQQKMKKEKQADLVFEQDMKQAQQAYEMGALKIKEAQSKADEILKAKQLDEGSSQIYQSVKMSGASEADALRAVAAYRTQNGGWAQRQADMEAQAEMLTKALSMAKLSPALAGKAADLINSNTDANGPQMTGAQLYEMQNRKEPIKINEHGDHLVPKFDSTTGTYTYAVERYQSKEQADEAAQEQKNKEREYRLKESQIGAEYARVRGGLAEAAMRSADAKLRAETDVKVALINKERAIEGAEKKGEYTKDIQELKGAQKLDQIAAKGGVDLTLVEARGEINKAMQEAKLEMQDKWKGLDITSKEKGQKILQEHYKATEALGKDTLELRRLTEKNDVKDSDRIFELKQKVQMHKMKMDEKSYELDKYVAESNKAAKEQDRQLREKQAAESNKISRERIAAALQKHSTTGASGQSVEYKLAIDQAKKASAEVYDAEQFAARVQEAKPSQLAELLRSKGMAPASGPGADETNRQRALAYAERVRAKAARAYENLGKYNPAAAKELGYLHLNSQNTSSAASGTSDLYNAPWMQRK
jgi:hypothetical protein